MAQENARDRLLDFLDERAFRPVLQADEDRYDESERRQLQEVREATKRERERFRERDSARGIVDEFDGDLSSDEAEEVHRQLKRLGLPALPDVEKDFHRLARDLGVAD